MSNRKFILFTLLFFVSLNIYSQSRYLENGIGGSGFQFNTSIDANGLNSVGASAAYSIGGIMDIGFAMSRSNGYIEGYDSTDWNFNFLYNLVAIKQTEYIPLSAQLEGSYGFTNKSAFDSSDTEINVEGQGFTVGGSVFREFNSKGLFSFLVGGKAEYRNYVFTETATTASEREENFLWGGLAGVSFKPNKYPIFTLEVELLYDQTAEGVYIQPSLLIITPDL